MSTIFSKFCMDKSVLNDFYASFVAFLMTSKQQIIAIGASQGLTAMQLFTLLYVDPENPRPMSTLSAILSCDPSNITGIVDGLEQKKLITRTENPKDRRVKMLKLNSAGEKMRRQILVELVDKNEATFFGVLNETERAQFVAIMRKVTALCPNRIKL